MTATLTTPIAAETTCATNVRTVLCLVDRQDLGNPSVTDAAPGVGRALADVTVDTNPMPAELEATVITAGASAAYAVGVPTDAHRDAAWMLDIFTQVVWKTQSIACPSVCVTGTNHVDIATAAAVTLLACGVPLDIACTAVNEALELDGIENAVSVWWTALTT